MSGSLVWKISRLRRMSGREIVFRAIRQIGQLIEKRRVIRGWAPKPSVSVTPCISLVPPLNEYKHSWEKRYVLDETTVGDLGSGIIELFSHHKVTIGEPTDWHLDPVSGVRSPTTYGKALNYRDAAVVGNVKVVWELGRQHHLVPLAVAYALTGEKRYLEAIRSQVDSWIDQNSFGKGIHWCSSLEVALRLITWSMVHSLIASRVGDQGLFSVVKDSKVLGESIYQQVWFVRHYFSRHSSAANHLFGELTGLWVASHVFDLGADGERWRAEAQDELEREIQLQVFSDGVDKEQALYYHLWMLEYAIFLQVAGRRFNSPYSAKFCKRTASMAEFIRDISPSRGKPPQIGDADDGFVTRFSATWPENPYEEVLHAERLITQECAERGLAEKAFWYGIIGGYAEALSGTKICESIFRPYPRVYSQGGYAVLGDKACHLVFDAGSLGYLSIAGHGHADALSFTLAIHGDWWLVDPGTYIYHDFPEWRDHFRSTRAHNCVVVDGKNQSVMSGPFMWSKHANARLISHGSESLVKQWVKGCHDGYQDIGVTHCREIKLDTQSKRIDVIDEFQGKKNHHFEIWFQCAPDVEVSGQSQNNVWTLTKNDSPGNIQLLVESDLKWEVLRGQERPTIAGWYSSRLGFREPSYALKGHGDCVIPKCIATSIIFNSIVRKN